MKAAAFDYECPSRVDEAVRLLAEAPGAKLLAGGQTLGPMLNLRLARPDLLIDITRIPELVRVEETNDAVTFGACVSHAAIEDGLAPDPAGGLMRDVAAGIAYRAVRTRGTIGGSLAHCDPSADWLSCLLALDATLSLSGAAGARTIGLSDFARGAMMSDLAPDEIIDGITVARVSGAAECGYAKICRKTGEFADAIGVAVHDPERGVSRFVVGATQGAPIVLTAEDLGFPADRPLPAVADGAVDGIGEAIAAREPSMDDYDTRIHAVALARAIKEACRA
ncbi:MAG: FAD binding domain-containing protein [Dichotomicrobium sp.]